jgi:hypothetical protein
MVRRAVHEAIGGFDETTKTAWRIDFPARAMGYWGSTIPEYLTGTGRSRIPIAGPPCRSASDIVSSCNTVSSCGIE